MLNSLTDSLKGISIINQLDILENVLDDSPDPWFNESFGKFLVLTDSKVPTTVLSRKYYAFNQNKINFFSNEDRLNVDFSLLINEIFNINFCSHHNSNPNTIELFTTKGNLLLSFDSHIRMMKWVLILKSSRSLYLFQQIPIRSAPTRNDNNWKPYNVIFPYKSPLNITFTTTTLKESDDSNKFQSFTMVEGFELDINGNIGLGELNGNILPQDLLIRVNNTDITQSPLNTVMQTILDADWPLQLHFIRDINSVVFGSWGVIYFKNTIKKIKVYVELIDKILYFRKPTKNELTLTTTTSSARSYRSGMVDLVFCTDIQSTGYHNLTSTIKDIPMHTSIKGVISFQFQSGTQLIVDNIFPLTSKPFEIDEILILFDNKNNYHLWHDALDINNITSDIKLYKYYVNKLLEPDSTTSTKRRTSNIDNQKEGYFQAIISSIKSYRNNYIQNQSQKIINKSLRDLQQNIKNSPSRTQTYLNTSNIANRNVYNSPHVTTVLTSSSSTTISSTFAIRLINILKWISAIISIIILLGILPIVLDRVAWYCADPSLHSKDIVELYPTYAYQYQHHHQLNDANNIITPNIEVSGATTSTTSSITTGWKVVVKGMVYQPAKLDIRKRLFLFGISTLAHYFGYDRRIATSRFELFLRNYKRGKSVQVALVKDASGNKYNCDNRETTTTSTNIHHETKSDKGIALQTEEAISVSSFQESDDVSIATAATAAMDAIIHKEAATEELQLYLPICERSEDTFILTHDLPIPSTAGGLVYSLFDWSSNCDNNVNSKCNKPSLSLSTDTDTCDTSNCYSLWLHVERKNEKNSKYSNNKGNLPTSSDNTSPISFIDNKGISVISDIDDTIKVTGVGSVSTILANTFLNPFAPIPGMAATYRAWAATSTSNTKSSSPNNNVHFHYVSSSPWMLATVLYQWMLDTEKEGGAFPPGSMHLKTFRFEPFELWGIDMSMFNLLRSPFSFKTQTIEAIFQDFPQRHFLLVGDSSEKDPEIYGDLLRRFPHQILCVIIRSVAERPMTVDRIQTAFREVDEMKYMTFEDNLKKVSLEDIPLDKGCSLLR